MELYSYRKDVRGYLREVKIYYLLTESEGNTGKSQTEALMYWPSDSEVNTLRPGSEISL